MPVLCKSGHAFIKQKMREVDGAYGGEMSAHHYFRDFSYCDSGMIPWLLVLQVICESRQDRCRSWSASACGCSRPAARSIASCTDAKAVLAAAEKRYEPGRAEHRFHRRPVGGIPRWRFNLRGSNTEPLVRLNVESRGR